ncbi:TPA: hypothetical protein HA251_02440 [Candidatus Woesearchaeota archaeon]|nr:hypothetical protein [Candidatus Woesearchaeota archaeon]
MGLEGICALYSFKINAPRFELLRGDTGIRPIEIDPYKEYRRPSLIKPINTAASNSWENNSQFDASESIGQLPKTRKLSHTGTVIPYGDLQTLNGETHDTFKIDRYGGVYGGHTTINVPGYRKKRVDWEEQNG